MTLRKKTFDEDDRIKLAELSSSISALDTDYRDLRTTVINLGKRIDDAMTSINAKIDQRFQPQWQTYIAGAMLVGGLFFAFIAPIQGIQKDHGTDIKAISQEHRDFVKDMRNVLDHRNDLFPTQKEFKEYQSHTSDLLSSIRKDVDRVEAAAIKANDAAALIYPPRNVFEELNRRISDLERRTK